MAQRWVRAPSWSYLGRDAWQRPRSALAWMMRWPFSARPLPGRGRHRRPARRPRRPHRRPGASGPLRGAWARGRGRHVPGDIAGVPKAEVLPIEVLPIEVSGVHRRTLRWATDMAPGLPSHARAIPRARRQLCTHRLHPQGESNTHLRSGHARATSQGLPRPSPVSQGAPRPHDPALLTRHVKPGPSMQIRVTVRETS